MIRGGARTLFILGFSMITIQCMFGLSWERNVGRKKDFCISIYTLTFVLIFRWTFGFCLGICAQQVGCLRWWISYAICT